MYYYLLDRVVSTIQKRRRRPNPLSPCTGTGLNARLLPQQQCSAVLAATASTRSRCILRTRCVVAWVSVEPTIQKRVGRPPLSLPSLSPLSPLSLPSLSLVKGIV